MKLSELIAYRTLLQRYQPSDSAAVMHQQLAPLMHAVDHSHIRLVDAEAQLHHSHDAVRASLEQFDHSVSVLLDTVEENIQGMMPGYLARSYQLYDENMRRDTPELILSRRIMPTSDTQEYLKARIKLFTDWRRAGMVLRPACESWIEDLVALDPLYLVDTHRELLEPARERFTPEYQRRLRTYVIDEHMDQPLLADLPNAQMGFCLAYNFFNYKPFELVKKYLQEIHDKLQPGGRFFFTINDCDREGGVANSERCYMCFTPSSLITPLVQTLGFVIHQTCEVDAACTWYEVQKPGEFTTLRGGQTLARINSREAPVDIPQESQYTSRQQEKLLRQAQKLGLDTSLPWQELQRLITERKSQ